MQVQGDPELTAKQASELAGVSDAHVRRLLISGKLRGRKLDGFIWLVRQSEVKRWLAHRRSK